MCLPSRISLYFCRIWLLMICLGSACLAQADVAEPAENSAALLLDKFTELGPQLSNNQFNRPLYLSSTESSNQSKGDIYALLDYPFAVVTQALHDPRHWCDVMILHLNTKDCQAATDSTGNSLLKVRVGKKTYQELDDAYLFEFAHNSASTTPAYFNVRFIAKAGPLGTRDYRLLLEAVSLQEGKTFLHLTYSYDFNFQGRLAMLAYLSTLGRGKVGFTDSVGGMRGAVERNTMRYYLAIDAYLESLSAPPAQQLEKRLQSWFTATELYTRQLHELDRDDYLNMKRREVLRMQKSPATAD